MAAMADGGLVPGVLEVQNRMEGIADRSDDHQLSVCNGCAIPYSLS